MSKSSQIELILAKVETSYGVDANPTAAVNAIRAANTTLTPYDAQTVGLDYKQATFGNSDQIITSEQVRLSFDVYCAGSGSAGTVPPVGVLLRGCAFQETIGSGSVSYDPISTDMESLTLYCYKDGLLHKITGARGTLRAEFSAGQVPRWSFEFTGKYNPVTDTAMPANVDYSSFILPRAAIPAYTGEISLFGLTTMKVKSFSLDTQTEVVKPEWVNYDAIEITDRKPTSSVEIEMTPVATKDWFGLVRSQSKGQVLYTHGIEAGNIIEIGYPSALLTAPLYGDNAKILTLQGTLTPLITNGNDDIAIEFK